MKKIILILMSAVLFTSCTSVPKYANQGQGSNTLNNTDLSRLNRDDYHITATVESQKSWTKTGPLFLLLGSNGGGEEMRREKVYLQACKQNGIDGIVQPKFETKRLVIPLIIWNYSQYSTYVVGKGYKIKTDGQKKLEGTK